MTSQEVLCADCPIRALSPSQVRKCLWGLEITYLNLTDFDPWVDGLDLANTAGIAGISSHAEGEAFEVCVARSFSNVNMCDNKFEEFNESKSDS